MNCPNCERPTSMRRVRRLGIYPVPVVLLQLGYYMALGWVLGRKWRWACPTCGAQIDRHSFLSRTYRILFWIGLAVLCLFVALAVLAIIALGILPIFE